MVPYENSYVDEMHVNFNRSNVKWESETKNPIPTTGFNLLGI